MALCNFLVALWINVYFYLVASFCFPKKGKRKYRMCIFLVFTLLQFLNICYNQSFYSTIGYGSLFLAFVSLEYIIPFTPLLFLGMILFFLRFFFEELFYIVLFLLNLSIPPFPYIFLFSSILTFLTSFIFKDFLKEHITRTYFFENKHVLGKYFFTNIILFCILYLRLPKYTNVVSLLYIILFFCMVFFNMTLLLLREKEKNMVLKKGLKQTVECAEFTEGLLLEYRNFSHEYKNKLITIKGLARKNNKELHNYIDTILQEKAVNNYRWLMEIKSIPISGVKGLINFKLLKMKELNIDVEFYITEEIEKEKLDLTMKEKNDLNTILGVIFDNAIEAALESKNPMISFQMYKEEKDKITILLANTFKEINIEQMEEKGFSTKGKNRGLGLSLLNETLKRNPRYTKNTSIFENFFVQKIFIDLKK